MTDALWRIAARILARPAVADCLIARAQRTPYFHLDGYMHRWWLVPYRNEVPRFASERIGAGARRTFRSTDGTGPVSPWRRPLAWLLQRFDVAIRVHHILRRDEGRDPHDHPWNARTVILRGRYEEVRNIAGTVGYWAGDTVWREAGDTARIAFGEYHSIIDVPPEGVWTLFITGCKRGTWGFMVDGAKVPHKEYLR